MEANINPNYIADQPSQLPVPKHDAPAQQQPPKVVRQHPGTNEQKQSLFNAFMQQQKTQRLISTRQVYILLSSSSYHS